MAGASRECVDAFLKDQQELIAAQLHRLAVNQSYLALAKFAEAEKYAPNWGRLRDLGPPFKSHEVESLNFKGGSYV